LAERGPAAIQHDLHPEQVQTNDATKGLATNRVDVPGATATNQVFLPVNRANSSVFYRMINP